MPPAEAIQLYLTGAWRMMNGRPEGLKMLDISADGFWTSFFAIAVAAPAMFAGWVAVAADMAAFGAGLGDQIFVIARLALVDLGAWLLPLVALALVAPHAGIGDRYAHYVIATNWSSALIVWIMLPPAMLRLMFPDAGDALNLASLALFVLTLVFSWRLTNIAIGKGAAMATGVFAGMVVASLFVLFGMQDLLGLEPPS